MIYRECYEYGHTTLAAAGIDEAAWDARLLLEHVCGTNRNDLLVHGDREVTSPQEARYRELIAQRAKRIPLQHLTGVQEFMGLEFKVNEHVLIPRQDTEILVEEVLKELHDGMRILDMCTGSGCILISLLHYSNGCGGVGVDISEEALKIARENAERLLKQGQSHEISVLQEQMSRDDFAEKLEQACDGADKETECQNDYVSDARFTFLQSDLFESVTGKYDFIVSNPPYIRSDVIPTLMPEVKDHEPMQALDGTEDGLFFYRRITDESRRFLVRGGMLYFEIGHDQAEAVSGLMAEAGFVEINVVKDFAGLDRVVYGTYIK